MIFTAPLWGSDARGSTVLEIFRLNAQPARPDPRLMQMAPVLREAMELHRTGQLAEAAELFRRVLKKIPDQFDALFHLALTKMIQGDPQEALKLIGKAIKVEPRAPIAQSLAGTILNMLGRREEALACYDRALALDPESDDRSQRPRKHVTSARTPARGADMLR